VRQGYDLAQPCVSSVVGFALARSETKHPVEILSFEEEH
jgi:hypothetical protein